MDDALKIKGDYDTDYNRKHNILLRHKYTHMNVSIATKQEEGILLRPGCGGAQGDVGMPNIFRRT